MNIVFRVDSSTELGAGHLMRCITLAHELQKRNHNITFICKKFKGNLINLINYKTLELPLNNNSKENSLKINYINTDQNEDAGQTIKVIPKNTDFLIVDCYSLGEKWHRQLRPYTKKIIVIDDLSNKQFDCDVLINQNLGSLEKDYSNKVPLECILLLGSKYVLLRPEFTQLREKAIKKRQNTLEVKNILISIGSSDNYNITYKILKQLDERFNIVVVLGELSPHNKMIKKYAKNKNIKVIVNANNMAQLMLEADFSIGAGGSTNWERLYLGLPSMVFTVADNQRKTAEILNNFGLIKLLGHFGGNKISNTLQKDILSINDLNNWSNRCFNNYSCYGISQVAEILIKSLNEK